MSPTTDSARSGVLEIDVITIFPGMLNGFLMESMLKRAVERGVARIRVVDLRQYTHDAHRTTDDRPYGGGPGMIMKPEPLCEAIDALKGEGSRVVLMTPQGRRFSQAVARELSAPGHMIFVCGHYEGIDERVGRLYEADELSIGDFVLTNGVLPAAVVIDAVVRLLPGALGAADATVEESFGPGGLEYPQFTRPPDYRGHAVPEVLLSGNHARIAAWRREQAEQRTRERRPDLLAGLQGQGE